MSRYRERHSTSGAKSDPGDARVLAELARTDHHNHRPIAGDSDLVESIKVLTRAHQGLIWTRQRQLNQLRSTLREFYPAAIAAFPELGHSDALAVLALAPTPSLGRLLSISKIAAALRRGGRQRRIDERAREIQIALRSDQLGAPDLVSESMGTVVKALVAVAGELSTQIAALELELAARFDQHPDAKVIRSLPGLGMILGARVLRRHHRQPGRPNLLRHPPSHRRHPQPSPTSPRQPPPRHPPRMPTPPNPLRRTHRLGPPHPTRRLTN